jgi:hypothetical protein
VLEKPGDVALLPRDIEGLHAQRSPTFRKQASPGSANGQAAAEKAPGIDNQSPAGRLQETGMDSAVLSSKSTPARVADLVKMAVD